MIITRQTTVSRTVSEFQQTDPTSSRIERISTGMFMKKMVRRIADRRRRPMKCPLSALVLPQWRVRFDSFTPQGATSNRKPHGPPQQLGCTGALTRPMAYDSKSVSGELSAQDAD